MIGSLREYVCVMRQTLPGRVHKTPKIDTHTHTLHNRAHPENQHTDDKQLELIITNNSVQKSQLS